MSFCIHPKSPSNQTLQKNISVTLCQKETEWHTNHRFLRAYTSNSLLPPKFKTISKGISETEMCRNYFCYN